MVQKRAKAPTRLDTWRTEQPGLADRALGPFMIHGAGPFVVWRSDGVDVAAYETLPEARAAMATANDDWLEQCRQIVYFIGAKLARGQLVKIGITNNVERRLRQLQAYSPVPLSIFATRVGGETLERELHSKWQRQRAHGEWFRLTDALIREIASLASPTPEITPSPEGSS